MAPIASATVTGFPAIVLAVTRSESAPGFVAAIPPPPLPVTDERSTVQLARAE